MCLSHVPLDFWRLRSHTHIESIISTPEKVSVLDYHSFELAVSAIQPNMFLLHETIKVGKSQYISYNQARISPPYAGLLCMEAVITAILRLLSI